MVAVAAVSIAFGVYVWGTRLKQRRDEFFARATWHASQETYYRRLVADSATSSFRRRMADIALESPEKTITAPVKIIERWLGLPDGNWTPAEENDRFKQAQARAGEMSARGRLIWSKYLQRQAAYNQRKLEYHNALRRKYVAAAARPWLPIDPDPPKPK
jgi:hypothetical protein